MARDKSSGGSNEASLALRIATVALSVASTVTMASATGCPAPAPASKVSYHDYKSLRYSLAASLISAALQALAVYLTTVRGGGGEQEAKAAKALAQLVDTAAQVLLYSSSALSFAVDDFGSCGVRLSAVCRTAGEFCRRVHVSGAISIAAAVALSVSLYLKDAPVSVSLDGDGRKSGPGCGRGCHCHH